MNMDPRKTWKADGVALISALVMAMLGGTVYMMAVGGDAFMVGHTDFMSLLRDATSGHKTAFMIVLYSFLMGSAVAIPLAIVLCVFVALPLFHLGDRLGSSRRVYLGLGIIVGLLNSAIITAAAVETQTLLMPAFYTVIASVMIAGPLAALIFWKVGRGQ